MSRLACTSCHTTLQRVGLDAVYSAGRVVCRRCEASEAVPFRDHDGYGPVDRQTACYEPTAPRFKNRIDYSRPVWDR